MGEAVAESIKLQNFRSRQDGREEETKTKLYRFIRTQTAYQCYIKKRIYLARYKFFAKYAKYVAAQQQTANKQPP